MGAKCVGDPARIIVHKLKSIFMKLVNGMIIISIYLFANLSCSAQMNSQSPITHVSAQRAQEYLSTGKYMILDIRTPMEFNASRIEGAINIDFYAKDFVDQLKELDKDKAYFVYCRSGNRTGQSMRIFESLGFREIVHLQRGIVDWTASGYQMIK